MQRCTSAAAARHERKRVAKGVVGWLSGVPGVGISRWSCRVAGDGRRHRVRRGGFRSRVAAEQARAYLLGGDVVPGRSAVSVAQWLDIWLETRQTLIFNTRRLYTQQVNDYLKPYLGSVPLRSLTVARVQAMFVGFARTNAGRRYVRLGWSLFFPVSLIALLRAQVGWAYSSFLGKNHRSLCLIQGDAQARAVSIAARWSRW
ncbi:hypothetical protein [Amycolatopsis sp. H20-H5]|uniref:hypothetical protein n=1 Tax=Amycolatopsis sp. H20-H5 TaxID=3046309 RepID=UPI003FA3A118